MKSVCIVLFGCSIIFAAKEAPKERESLRAMVNRRHQQGDENSNAMEYLQRLASDRSFSSQAQTILTYIAAAHKQGAGRRRRGLAFDKTLINETVQALHALQPVHGKQINRALATCRRPAITNITRAGYRVYGKPGLDDALRMHDESGIGENLDELFKEFFVPGVKMLIISYVNFSDRQVGIRLCEYPKDAELVSAPICDLTGLGKWPGIDRRSKLNLNGCRLGLGFGALFSEQQLKKFAGLQRLLLRNNNLYSLKPGALGPFADLRMLNLSNNNFTQMPDVVCLKLLQSLYMRDNLLTQFPSIKHPRLQYLNLSRNMIAKIGKGVLADLPKLRVLDLRGNPVQELPEDMQKLIRAHKLKVMMDNQETGQRTKE